MKVKGGSLPRGLHWASPQPFFSHLHDIASPWGLRCEVLVFQQDLRFLWLPKDTKSERPSLARSSLEKRAVLDYT